jgi:hypothetical protein
MVSVGNPAYPTPYYKTTLATLHYTGRSSPVEEKNRLMVRFETGFESNLKRLAEYASVS